MKPKLLIVGAGFFGLTIAEHAARVLGISVLVLEKRDHIGGNAFSYRDTKSGIEVHKYGSHLFHTSNQAVWQYVNRFDSFNDYQHKVMTFHNGQYFSMPVNLHSISQLFGMALTPETARALVSEEASKFISDSTLDSFATRAKSKIGERLYQAFFEGYTAKQWQVSPENLPGEVFSRLPIRFDFNTRYFNDSFEGLPVSGYGAVFQNMSSDSKIKIEYGVDFFDSNWAKDKPVLTIFTGPIDRYFNYQYGQLNWRTLDFEFEHLQIGDYQGTSVLNFADLEVPYTRIHEFRHLHPEREMDPNRTIIAREFSRRADVHDEPYYPVNAPLDREKLLKYRELAKAEAGVIFGGRLGRYQYLDMHMAIASAMQVFETEVRPLFQ